MVEVGKYEAIIIFYMQYYLWKEKVRKGKSWSRGNGYN